MENLRPLTLEEQLFAAQNHNLVYAFLQEKELSELEKELITTDRRELKEIVDRARKESQYEQTE